MSSQPSTILTPLKLWPACILAALGGVLLIAPFVIEQAFPVAWFALVPLLLSVYGQRPFPAAALGLLAGTVAHLIGLNWLVGTMVRFGGLPVSASLGLYVLIAVGLGTIFIPFVLISRLVWSRSSTDTLRSAIFIAATFTASEFSFPNVFPWILGYSQAPLLELIQIADVTGAYGITFIVALSSAVIFQLLVAFKKPSARVSWTGIAGVLVVVACSLVYGLVRLESVRTDLADATTIRIALLQPNVGFEEKYDSAFTDEQHARLFAMSQRGVAADAELIVWPETGFREVIWGDQTHIDVPVTMPAPTSLYVGSNVFDRGEDTIASYNSALLISSDGLILDRYDKQRLFPFGEYVPFADVFPFLKAIAGPIGNFTPGRRPPVHALPAGILIGPLICYEDIFADLSRFAVRAGAKMLVNLTNDVWFGDTVEPHQHLQLSRFRAVENRVPLARATNTGLTAIVDPTGEVVVRLDPFTEAMVVHDVPLLAITTFYTRYGDVFATLCLLGVLITVSLLWVARRP